MSKDYNNNRSFGGNNHGGKQMFQAVCNECKKSCEVPFRPSGDKPVYCKDCFNKKRGDGNNQPQQQKRDFNNRPNFQSNNQTQQNQRPMSPQKDVSGQLAEINDKIDRLIDLMSKTIKTKKSAVVSVVK